MKTRLACLLLSVVALTSAQEDVAIRVDVRLVRVLASVKDRSGALVGSLTKSDFQLTDNGAPQTISVFEPQTDQPLSVAILIDNSGSTAKDLKYEVDSVNRFVKSLVREGNPEDAVALYSFNWEIVRHNNFTRNIGSIDKSLRALHGEAGTSLYDAILLASRDIQDRAGRKILVVVTDGGDTVSRTDFNRATEAAQLADAVIYPILVVPITNQAGRNVGGENALTTFAQRTGGRVFAPTLGAQMDQAFDQIVHDLRTQYLLGFYPKDTPLTPDRFHALQITVAKPDLRVTARSGYYGEARQEGSAAYSGSVNSPAGTTPGDETVRQPRKPAPAKKTKGP
jgi:Ca-activated chloride channel family protein